MIVLVELSTRGDYDSNGEVYDYHEIGDVFGPFETVDEASAYADKLNDERGYYTYLGRRRRIDMRDFEVKELIAPR
ncbi:MAG: hypothetical protein RJB65_2567 [Actinomycetota bacterium]|jgi:hypothetical protein